jgi:DNA-binding NtrC family response regulator
LNLSKKKDGSILVLDDDFDISNLPKISLKKQGYTVFSFTDPLSALEHHSTYSLVITDLRMPVMSGFEFLRNIRVIKPEINVILMSAYETSGDDEFTNFTKNYAIGGFIQKTVGMKKLLGLVESQMAATWITKAIRPTFIMYKVHGTLDEPWHLKIYSKGTLQKFQSN